MTAPLKITRVLLRVARSEVIPLAGAMAPAQVPDELLPWVTATILGLTYVYLTDPQNQLALKQSFDVPRRGIVGNSCPKKENNECGHRLCRGSDEVCTHKFLEGCACSNTCSIPADAKRWFVCNERACGGADKNGECNGVSWMLQFDGEVYAYLTIIRILQAQTKAASVCVLRTANRSM